MIKEFFKKLRKNKPEIIPVNEPVDHMVSHDLARGSNYLVIEEKPEYSFDVFTSIVKGICKDCDQPEAFHCESIGCEGCTLSCPCKSCNLVRAQGLCFTTRSPEEIRTVYTLQTTPIFWISNRGMGSINPSNLELMIEVISKFFRKSKNPVLIFDGIEYLIVTDGFVSVLKFLRDVMEEVILKEGIFILPINPLAISEKELALIGRDMKELIAQNGKWFYDHGILQKG